GRRAVFFPLESFPTRTRLVLEPGGGRLDLDGEAIPLHEIVSACLDGIYVPPEPLSHLGEKDREFAQTEAWAALIALFDRLPRVANVIRPRDVVESRFSLMSFLAARGLPVPRMLVTSDAMEAERFGAARYRTLSDLPSPFTPEQVQLCPLHFEEVLSGPRTRLVVIGEQTFGPELPGATGVCHELGLLMAELVLQDGVVVELCTHLTGEGLAVPGVLDAAATLLEQ
ncbi:MAG: hypothetical protein ACYCW6_25130, partial [Candidatus Xenobia bacterium]